MPGVELENQALFVAATAAAVGDRLPSLSRKRATPGMRMMKWPPAICQVGPCAVAPANVSGTAPWRIMTSGAATPSGAGCAPGRASSLVTVSPDSEYDCTTKLRPSGPDYMSCRAHL